MGQGRGKVGARSGQVHQMRGKTWEIMLPQDTKVEKKLLILGSNLKFRGQDLGYLSPIFLKAKFRAPTRISEANFGPSPPNILRWKYPLWEIFINMLNNYSYTGLINVFLDCYIYFKGKVVPSKRKPFKY